MSVSGKDIVDYLMQFRGTPYAWGGNSLTGGIDCSGLLQQGFAHFGINIARVTNDQIGQGQAVGLKDLQIGDAVFFDTDPGREGPDHVGIYIGNGKMLHAPKTGDVVKVTDITSDYYMSRFMGGRRFNGVAGGGDANNDWATQSDVEKKLSPEEMSAKYGFAYSFLNSEPSLKDLFGKAVDENWTADKFQAELKNTDFWKDNSASARKALEMKNSDPATWNALMDANRDKILQAATAMGATIPESSLKQIAEDMEMTGMSDERLNQILGGYVDFLSNGSMGGVAGVHEQVMRKYASDMGVDINQQAIKNYAQMMVKGVGTDQDFKNFVNQQATSLFPAYADQIKSGLTMRNIANPYIQMMAQNLEMNPNDITMKDPTIMGALNGLDESGKPVGRTMSEFENALRADPRWRGTQQAQDKAMNVGMSVLRNWGVVS